VDQRTGVVRIFVKFPLLEEFLHNDLSGAMTPQGKVLYCELIADAFARTIAIRKMEQEGYVRGPTADAVSLGTEREAYLRIYNDALRRATPLIYYNWKALPPALTGQSE